MKQHAGLFKGFLLFESFRFVGSEEVLRVTLCSQLPPPPGLVMQLVLLLAAGTLPCLVVLHTSSHSHGLDPGLGQFPL